MKIISKYTDYYDIYARNATLSDQTFRWNRTHSNIKTDLNSPKIFAHQLGRWNKKDTEIDMFGFNIFFCGRIIPVLYLKKAVREFQPNAEVCADYFYDIDSLPAYIKDLKNHKYNGTWKEIVDLFEVVNNKWNDKLPNGMTLIRKDIVEMHRQLQSPVFVNCNVISDFSTKENFNEPCCRIIDTDFISTFTANPQLSKFNFIKKIDAFSCFNELERFLSNDMSTYRDKSDQVKISDKLKAETHGFNKFSFRKDKSTK